MGGILANSSLCRSINKERKKEIGAYLFGREWIRLNRKSGCLFAALYLKQAALVLQKYYAGDEIPVSLAPSISLTRSGLPRIIPSFHRRMISKRDDRADRLVKIYLSFFSIARAVYLAPRMTKSTLKSISDPHPSLDKLMEVAGRMRPFIRPLLTRYVPSISRIPLHLGLSWVPTWKSTPSMSWISQLYARSSDSAGRPLTKFRRYRSIFTSLFAEIAAFAWLVRFVHAMAEQWSQGTLWAPFTRFPFDNSNALLSGWALDWFERRVGPYLPLPEHMNIPPLTGKLGSTCAGAGKLRLFAIGNYVNQRLLAPIHEWLAHVLRSIPMDGTYNQLRPLDRLAGSQGTIYSIDLKSATGLFDFYLS